MELTRYGIGQALIYTGKAGTMPAEFRGYHHSPETFGTVARIIARPEGAPWFECSVPPEEIQAAPRWADRNDGGVTSGRRT